MKKSDLIKELFQVRGTFKAAELAVDVTFESMAKALAEDGRVEIRGFGSFKIKHYYGYKGRNPKTGKAISITSKELPCFRVGEELKERGGGGEEEDLKLGSGSAGLIMFPYGNRGSVRASPLPLFREVSS